MYSHREKVIESGGGDIQILEENDRDKKKNNFVNNPQSCLINASKTKFGLILKNILKKIILSIQQNSSANLWKDFSDAIKWFQNITNKKNATFIQFNIIDFYPSISEDLLLNSLNFAKNYINITDDEQKIIVASKDLYLYIMTLLGLNRTMKTSMFLWKHSNLLK